MGQGWSETQRNGEIPPSTKSCNLFRSVDLFNLFDLRLLRLQKGSMHPASMVHSTVYCFTCSLYTGTVYIRPGHVCIIQYQTIKLSYLYHFIPIILPYFLYQCHCHPMPSSTIQCHRAEISDFVHEIVHEIVLCVTEVLTSCARVCHCCLHGILSGLERHGQRRKCKHVKRKAIRGYQKPQPGTKKRLSFNPHKPNSSLDSFLARNLQAHGKFAICTSSSFNAMDLRGLGRVFQNQLLELSPLPAKLRV